MIALKTGVNMVKQTVLPALLAATIAVFLSACSGQMASSSASTSDVSTNGAEASSSSASADASSSVSSSSAAAEQAMAERRAAKEAFVGTWNVVDMERNGQRASEVNPDAAAALSENGFINFYDDGFFDYVVNGETSQGIWEAASPTEGTATLINAEAPMTITDGVLALNATSTDILYFEKGEHRDAPAVPEGQPDLRQLLSD